MGKHAFVFVIGTLIVLSFVLVSATAKKCEFTSALPGDSKPQGTQEEMICPGPNDPSNYTECCVDPKFVCCPESPIAYHIDNGIVRVVGMIVITTCICLSIVVLVCCFWNSCPLYNTCREDYTLTDVVAYTKDDDSIDSDILPGENARKRNYNVKIKPVEEVLFCR